MMAARTHLFAALLAALSADAAHADSVIAARTIPARAVIGAGDLNVVDEAFPGALADPATAIGLETRVTLYQGRPVTSGDLGPPALVERNEIVALLFDQRGLTILTEGRALDRAAVGERVRVMNLSSRITVTGTVTGPGEISVP